MIISKLEERELPTLSLEKAAECLLFDNVFEIYQKKYKLQKYFIVVCNFKKSVMVDELNISLTYWFLCIEWTSILKTGERNPKKI